MKKSAATLKALQKLVTRLRGRKLSEGCADLLVGSIDDARVRATRWLAAPTLGPTAR